MKKNSFSGFQLQQETAQVELTGSCSQIATACLFLLSRWFYLCRKHSPEQHKHKFTGEQHAMARAARSVHAVLFETTEKTDVGFAGADAVSEKCEL